MDGKNRIVAVREGSPADDKVWTDLGPGRHTLVLFKRSEANAGSAQFRGVELDAGAKAWAPKLPDNKLRMEFIGDSITVGACNEDGDTDQWDDRRTHNAHLSYAALTAEAFNADYRNISVSGMGVTIGYVDMTAIQVWDKLRPYASSDRADLSKWTPQVVLVKLGDNDESFTKARGEPFPADFSDGYVTLIGAIRKAYPAAHIVLMYGGMAGGMRSEPLRKAWDAAVEKLEAGDKNISHFVFKHFSENHPRIADDKAMADELIAWLKEQDFMRPYR